MAESRNHPIITVQQQRWLEARATGMTPVEAARVAGYKDPYNAAFRLSRNQTLLLFNQMVASAHGVDLPAFFQTIKEALSANKLIKATKDGAITDTMEVPDWDIRLRAVQLGADLTGVKPAEEHKLVKEEEESTVFMVPDNFHEMTEAELLRDQQMRRQALMAGIPYQPPMKPVESVERISEDGEAEENV